MIILTPAILALTAPWADIAVRNWLGVVVRRYNVMIKARSRFHLVAQQPEIRGVIVGAVRMHARYRIRRDDVEILRFQSLHFGEHRGVQAELEDRPAAGLESKLRVGDLV